MAVKLTPNLSRDYYTLFNTCQIKSEKLSEINFITGKIISNKNRYETVAKALKIPWYFISLIHCMEASMRFDKHLHNGDPLTARTTHVPAGRPATGTPPFTWEESAKDALIMKKLDQWTNWTIPGILYKLEGYNGFGYRSNHPEVLTPYLWSFSNHYSKGKYVADGTFSETAVSKQAGAAVILRRLAELQEVKLNPGLDTFNNNEIPELKLIKYSNKESDGGKKLQEFLNQFPGIHLNPDGKPGKNTSDAFNKLFGYYLKGDPRITV